MKKWKSFRKNFYDCARQSAVLDERMQGIRDRITKKQEQETILLEDKNSKRLVIKTISVTNVHIGDIIYQEMIIDISFFFIRFHINMEANVIARK